MPRTILILSSTPRDMAPLRVHEEAREIEDAIRRARYRDEYQVIARLGIRARDVHRVLLEHRPAIIHFSGHGHGEHGLILEDDHGDSLLVSGANLARMLGHFRREIECVLFNACHSHAQIDEIAGHIPFVIGMNQALPDRAAVTFAGAFYEALGSGKSIPFAHELACSAVSVSGLSMDSVAVLAPATLAARDGGHASAARRRTRRKDRQKYVAYGSLIAITMLGLFSMTRWPMDSSRHEHRDENVTPAAPGSAVAHDASPGPPSTPLQSLVAPQHAFILPSRSFGAPSENRQPAPRTVDQARPDPLASHSGGDTDAFEILDVVVVARRDHYRVIVKASSRTRPPAELRSISISWTTGTEALCAMDGGSSTYATTQVDMLNLHHYVISDTYVLFADGGKAWVDSQVGLTAGHRHAAAFKVFSFCGGHGVSFRFDTTGKIYRDRGITIMVDIPKQIHSAGSRTISMPIPDCRRISQDKPAHPERQPSPIGAPAIDAKTQARLERRRLAEEERARLEDGMRRLIRSRITVELTADVGRKWFIEDALPVAQLSCQERRKSAPRR